MSKTVYYLGAGASYGKRDDKGKILEGVPIVAEIPKEFDDFRNYIKDAVIPVGDVTFWDKVIIGSESISAERQYMLRDIDSLKERIKEHATIDTYARKLYLTRNRHEFIKLKNVLCSFFVWEQLDKKPDSRYDTFLANILEAQSLDLPKDISIISWNYDSQIETAFRAYRQKPGLSVFEKNIQYNWPQLNNSGRLFKINGSATFTDESIIPYLEQSDSLAAVQLINFYSYLGVDSSSFGYEVKTHLSFAWEASPNSDKMRKSLENTILDTEQVVVIGYSFPFFNRETDRNILNRMPNLKTVYIQDKNPSAVKQAIEAVLPDREVNIIPIDNCDQFYLPKEL